MFAPPKPPSHDELEALIREARSRQRRRRLLGAAGVAVVAALALSVYGLLGLGAQRTAASSGGGPQATTSCGVASGWRLRMDPSGWSEPTGQNTAVIYLLRRGSNSCSLRGYPTIVLSDSGGRTLGFRYSHGGDLVVSARAPQTVHTGRRGAFFIFDKYRCDVRAAGVARELRVRVPGVRGWLALRLPHYPIIDFCPAEGPSTTIAVSPVVARLSQAAAAIH
jgi:hypothetical protein